MPSSSSRSAIRVASAASPIITGTIGCSPALDVEARVGDSRAEETGVRLQTVAKLGRLREQLKRRKRATDDRRRKRIAEQIGPRPLPQVIDDLLPRGGVSAAGAAQCFTERAGEDIDAAHHAVMLVSAAAALAHETGGVRVIHHHQGVVFVGKLTDGGQIGDDPVHGEHAVGGDQAEAGRAGFLQLRFQVRHFVVAVPEALSL